MQEHNSHFLQRQDTQTMLNSLSIINWAASVLLFQKMPFTPYLNTYLLLKCLRLNQPSHIHSTLPPLFIDEQQEPFKIDEFTAVSTHHCKFVPQKRYLIFKCIKLLTSVWYLTLFWGTVMALRFQKLCLGIKYKKLEYFIAKGNQTKSVVQRLLHWFSESSKRDFFFWLPVRKWDHFPPRCVTNHLLNSHLRLKRKRWINFGFLQEIEGLFHAKKKKKKERASMDKSIFEYTDFIMHTNTQTHTWSPISTATLQLLLFIYCYYRDAGGLQSRSRLYSLVLHSCTNNSKGWSCSCVAFLSNSASGL